MELWGIVSRDVCMCVCVCVCFWCGGGGGDVVGQWFWGGLCVSHGQIGECVRIREGDSVGGNRPLVLLDIQEPFQFVWLCLLRPTMSCLDEILKLLHLLSKSIATLKCHLKNEYFNFHD